MVEHTLWTMLDLLIQGYCAITDCATEDCARLHNERYYCMTGKEKNTTDCAHNTYLRKKVNTIKYYRQKGKEMCYTKVQHSLSKLQCISTGVHYCAYSSGVDLDNESGLL